MRGERGIAAGISLVIGFLIALLIFGEPGIFGPIEGTSRRGCSLPWAWSAG